MRKHLIAIACVAALASLTIGVALADLPAPTDEQVEAKLKEVRKRLEAARAEEAALLKQLEAAKESPRGQIKAEVEGILCWREDGGGYYIRIRPKDDPKRETRVWLAVSEDKVTVRKLEGLNGKDVAAKGFLQQRPTGSTGWWIPSGGMYLTGFEVDEVAVRLPECRTRGSKLVGGAKRQA